MKKLFIILALALMLPASVWGLDDRNRTTETIVADALAQLPAQKSAKFNALMGELAATGAEGIADMGSMLQPADKGKNATVEYALHGVTSYVTAPANEKYRAGVREGLKKALASCTDNANRDFLLSLLQQCATADDAAEIARYVEDPYLMNRAVNTLVSIPGTEEIITALVANESAPRTVLANAAAAKGLTSTEPVLLTWAAAATDNATKKVLNEALGKIGTAKSLKYLGNAARQASYLQSTDGATEGYIALLGRLSRNGEKKQAGKHAEKLLRNAGASHVRAGALQVLVDALGEKAQRHLLLCIMGEDEQLRAGALRMAEGVATQEFYQGLDKMLTLEGRTPVKVNIINWYAATHNKAELPAVLNAISSNEEELAEAAIKAAGVLGGDDALKALVAQLGGQHNDAAVKALLAFNGNVSPAIAEVINGKNSAAQTAALGIAARRHMTGVSKKVFDLLKSKDANVSKAAYAALPGVVTADDYAKLCNLLEADKGTNVKTLQEALKNSAAGMDADKQYAAVSGRMAKSSKPERYYPLLAQSSTSEAIAALDKATKGAHAKEATNSLMTVNNTEVLPVLYNLALANKAEAPKLMRRYATLVAKSGFPEMRKLQLCRAALGATDDAKVRSQILKGLSTYPNYAVLLLADNYVADAGTGLAAAETIRKIVSTNPAEFGGAQTKATLDKAVAQYRRDGRADSGYAIDDIKGFIGKLPATGYEKVTDVTLQPVVANAEALKSMKRRELTKARTAAESAAKNWTVADGAVKYSGTAPSIMALGDAKENFEMLIEWKGDSAVIGVRDIAPIALGGAVNPEGEWNTTYVKVLNDRITVEENGVKLLENAVLTNPYNPSIPAYAQGAIMLGSKGAPVEFRDIYVRELPSTPVYELSAEEAAEGFKVLFDGRSMHNWEGNLTNYVPVDGNIYVTAQYGKGGNLYTVDEFGDFIYRFEFCFEREGVNNGVGIRNTAMNVDAAYEGMEIQILDHDAPAYKNLREYQVHGSVYGIIPAKRIKHKPLGEWSTEEIKAVGDHITVTVNGEVILDGNIREACQGHNVSEDGSKRNPYTVDHKNHPGLFNKKGRISFCGHGAGVKFRNIRIKNLDEAGK